MSIGKDSRTLVVKLGAIGDVIMVLPAVYALHQRGSRIDWVCGRGVAPLLNCYPWIRTFVVDDYAILRGSAMERFKALSALWRLIGWQKYDVCATLYYDARYRIVTLPVRASRRLMLSKTNRSLQLLPGRHHTDEYARILLGMEDGERMVGLSPVRPGRLPDSPLIRGEALRVVLFPGGARNTMRDDALRRWPIENYVLLASELKALGLEVVIAGGADDGWVKRYFAELLVADVVSELTLVETLALLDTSDLVVTHDTGPLHLAGLTEAGIVSIFGPTDPWGRLPQRADTVAIWGGEGFACRPCYDGVNFAPCKSNGCMQQVKVEMVMREVKAVLEQRRSGSKPPRVVLPVRAMGTGL